MRRSGLFMMSFNVTGCPSFSLMFSSNEFTTRTRAEWGEALDAEGVWWAPVQTTEEVLADPQAWAGGGFLEVPDGSSTAMMVNSPCDFAGTPTEARSMPPELGQHTDEILAAMGKEPGDIAHLRRTGAVI